MRRVDHERIGGGRCTFKSVPGSIDRHRRVRAKGYRHIRPKECHAKHEYEPDETPVLASARREASALWPPARSYLGAGVTWAALLGETTGRASVFAIEAQTQPETTASVRQSALELADFIAGRNPASHSQCGSRRNTKPRGRLVQAGCNGGPHHARTRQSPDRISRHSI